MRPLWGLIGDCSLEPTSGDRRKIIPIVAAADDSAELVSLYAAQQKIHPRSVSGFFSQWRWALVIFTQLVFYGLPWLEWGQRQAVLFDLPSNRLHRDLSLDRAPHRR